jgi:hypothetical protein
MIILYFCCSAEVVVAAIGRRQWKGSHVGDGVQSDRFGTLAPPQYDLVVERSFRWSAYRQTQWLWELGCPMLWTEQTDLTLRDVV